MTVDKDLLLVDIVCVIICLNIVSGRCIKWMLDREKEHF